MPKGKLKTTSLMTPHQARLRNLTYSMTMFMDITITIIKDPSNNPEIFISMSDIICLPSYREGFGSVIIEAAASGVPSIVSDIYGLKDSIIEHETGLKFPKGNIEDLSKAMLEMYTNKNLRKKFSQNARIRSVNLFNQKKFINAFEDFYKSKNLI